MPTMTPSPATLLDRASDHLTLAADLAEPGDPALAGQIRLAAATLPAATLPAATRDADHAERHARTAFGTTTPDGPGAGNGVSVAGLLGLALDCLDQIAPLDGPADLQICAWHIHELRRIATHPIAS